MLVDRGDIQQEDPKWRIKLTGKLLNGKADQDILQGSTSHFMAYFSRIKVDFKHIVG